MSEDVAMEDEIADVHSAEVHEHLDLWVRKTGLPLALTQAGGTSPLFAGGGPSQNGNLDHVEELAVDGRRLLCSPLASKSSCSSTLNGSGAGGIRGSPERGSGSIHCSTVPWVVMIDGGLLLSNGVSIGTPLVTWVAHWLPAAVTIRRR